MPLCEDISLQPFTQSTSPTVYADRATSGQIYQGKFWIDQDGFNTLALRELAELPEGIPSEGRSVARCVDDISTLMVAERPEAWGRNICQSLGYRVLKADGVNRQWTIQYPTLASMNENLKAVGWPSDGSLPVFTPFRGGLYSAEEGVSALANGEVLVSDELVEGMHDIVGHVRNWLFIGPTWFSLIKKTAQALQKASSTSLQGSFIDQIEIASGSVANKVERMFDSPIAESNNMSLFSNLIDLSTRVKGLAIDQPGDKPAIALNTLAHSMWLKQALVR
jgi:hypothetical protein